MGGVERVGDLVADVDRPGRLERRLRVDEVAQRAALDVPHHEVELPVALAGVVDRDDVRVLERRRELGLREEAHAEPLVVRDLGREELDRHRALQAWVVRAVDDPHPATADELLDTVSEELAADPRVGADRAAHRRKGTTTSCVVQRGQIIRPGASRRSAALRARSRRSRAT